MSEWIEVPDENGLRILHNEGSIDKVELCGQTLPIKYMDSYPSEDAMMEEIYFKAVDYLARAEKLEADNKELKTTIARLKGEI